MPHIAHQLASLKQTVESRPSKEDVLRIVRDALRTSGAGQAAAGQAGSRRSAGFATVDALSSPTTYDSVLAGGSTLPSTTSVGALASTAAAESTDAPPGRLDVQRYGRWQVVCVCVLAREAECVTWSVCECICLCESVSVFVGG